MHNRVLIVEDVVATSADIRAAFIRGGLRPNQVVQSYALFAAMIEIRKNRSHPFRALTVDLVLGGDIWAGVRMIEFLAEQKPIRPCTVVLYSHSAGADQSFKTPAYWGELARRVTWAEASGRVKVRNHLEQLGDHFTLTQLVSALLAE